MWRIAASTRERPGVSYRYFASAPRGFEDLLENELGSFGADRIRRRPGGVTFRGSLEAGYRACLWSRVADHVLIQIGRFRAATPEALYEGARGILWREHLNTSKTISVTFVARGRVFPHSHFAALKVKDAVVDQFRDATGRRPSVNLTDPDVRIHVFAEGETISISIDLAGPPLHRRGYRARLVKAPIKETLAAGILLRAGWPEIARRGGALVDPMCGSATFLIEGAWMALDTAPGSLRERFGLLGWEQHDAGLWRRLRVNAKERAAAGSGIQPAIFGFDADETAIAAAGANLAKAGVSGRVRVERRALAELETPKAAGHSTGLVVTNPPYGERLQKHQDLDALYRTLGETLRSRFSGWEVSVLAGESAPVGAIGLRPRRTHDVFNGPIRCRLLRYASDSDAVPRGSKADARADPESSAAPFEATDFANRLRKNLRTLGRWAKQNRIDCYRVYDADVPEYALAVDLYYSESLWALVQEYAAPKSVDATRASGRLTAALAAIPRVIGVPEQRVVLKRRQRQRGNRQYRRVAASDEFLEVKEAGCRFLVNLRDRIDTGLYLDHRPIRALIRAHAHGHRFLNLFAYTGAASVHAAAGGATSTLSIDMSATYLEWGLRNFALNGLASPCHRYVRADCAEWIHAAPAAAFDLILLDPPTFSNSKRMRGTLDIQRDHVSLIQGTMRLLSPDGILLFSNHAKRFRLDKTALSAFQVEDISEQTIPRDFYRSRRIHGCWRISRR